jgi:hypothetical protein
MACLDNLMPGSVAAFAAKEQQRAYFGLSTPSTPAGTVLLTGEYYVTSQGAILFGAFPKLLAMDPMATSSIAGSRSDCPFEPDDTCSSEVLVKQLLDDVPPEQLRTMKGLRVSLCKVAVTDAGVNTGNTGMGDCGLKTGLVQVAVTEEREGLGLRGFFRGALPLLQKCATEPITAQAGSHAKAADVIRSHVYSLVHVARILATVHNMLLPNT